jgi:hypothetical protein
MGTTTAAKRVTSCFWASRQLYNQQWHDICERLGIQAYSADLQHQFWMIIPSDDLWPVLQDPNCGIPWSESVQCKVQFAHDFEHQSAPTLWMAFWLGNVRQ